MSNIDELAAKMRAAAKTAADVWYSQHCEDCADKMQAHASASGPENVLAILDDRDRLAERVAELEASLSCVDAARKMNEMALLGKIAELEAMLGAAWDAGAAHAIGSHECFKQTHPSKEEWLALHAPKDAKP